jgi:hypothetical protein
MRPITLCVPPLPGELCAPVTIDLQRENTFLELTSRHRVTEVRPDTAGEQVAVTVEITDPAVSRPIHVRFDLLPLESEVPTRVRLLGTFERGGTPMGVYGCYLGVVHPEN